MILGKNKNKVKKIYKTPILWKLCFKEKLILKEPSVLNLKTMKETQHMI